LGDLAESLELCDETGRVLAFVVPAPEIVLGPGGEPVLTEEELQRREQEPDYSTEEVLAYLERL
jgi:hypothetical protein